EASASETRVDIITTIDHNPASGIARIAREIMADIIVLGWPRKVGLIDKLIGQKVDGILDNTDKTTFICQMERPLVLHKRIVVAVPPLAEHENQFELLLSKLTKLAQELSITILFYCNEPTKRTLETIFEKARLTPLIKIQRLTDWDDFFLYFKNIREDDLMVLVSARKGSPSHMGGLDRLPNKLEKHFSGNSKLII